MLALGDPTFTERALSNLVENATRHNVSGGHVAVVLETEGSEFVLRVLDDGPGLTREECERALRVGRAGRRGTFARLCRRARALDRRPRRADPEVAFRADAWGVRRARGRASRSGGRDAEGPVGDCCPSPVRCGHRRQGCEPRPLHAVCFWRRSPRSAATRSSCPRVIARRNHGEPRSGFLHRGHLIDRAPRDRLPAPRRGRLQGRSARRRPRPRTAAPAACGGASRGRRPTPDVGRRGAARAGRDVHP
ncbi:MAG: ATP-binding protein [Candidatus Moduliflexus flocculans]|nr:ATP-binding protein [Candidatus Moduliflexus flocculans]